MTLAEQTQYARHRTMIYIESLLSEDWYSPADINGQYLNSISWIVAHIAVSQNFLHNYCIGKDMVKIPWARQFGMGSLPSSREDSPSQSEILDVMNKVYKNSLSNIQSTDPKSLLAPNPIGFKNPNSEQILSYEEVINHGIWHESHHSGQLAIWMKTLGKKTI